MKPVNLRIFPNWLSDEAFAWIRETSRMREYMRCDVNGVGDRWRVEATDEEVALILRRKNAILEALGLPIIPVVPMYWDSVLRTQSDGLDVHNDFIPEPRVVALAYYCNRFWHNEWGGAVAFYEKRTSKEPFMRIPPTPNTLVAFEVTESTWHSVLPTEGHCVRHAFIGWLNKPGPVPAENTVIEDRGDRWRPGLQLTW